MLWYYKHSLIDLFTKIQTLQDHPMEAFEECFAIQQILIQRIVYVERKIRQTRQRISELKEQLTVRQTKEKAQEIRITRDDLYQRIEEYQNVIYLFRSIGDALAFTYLSKWDIKPMVFKQSAGFLSGKAGFRAERWFLKKLLGIPIIAILNDLTNNLRYGDLTVIKEGMPLIVEVKSNSQQINKKQLEGVQQINEYLRIDEIEGLYFTGKQVRVDLHAPERNHIHEINDLIGQALQKGASFAEVEKGLIYYVDASNNPQKLEEIFQRINRAFRTPILFSLNSVKYNTLGYYPFTLSLKEPAVAYAFYADLIKIMIVVDFKVVVDMLASQNLAVEYLDNPDISLKITNINFQKDSREYDEAYFSRHFFGRLFYEFMSLEWLIEELIYGVRNEAQMEESDLDSLTKLTPEE